MRVLRCTQTWRGAQHDCDVDAFVHGNCKQRNFRTQECGREQTTHGTLLPLPRSTLMVSCTAGWSAGMVLTCVKNLQHVVKHKRRDTDEGVVVYVVSVSTTTTRTTTMTRMTGSGNSDGVER